MTKHPYLTLGGFDCYSEQPPTYIIHKYKVGDKVRILVNYLSELELEDDCDPVWESTITSIDLNDPELPYYIEKTKCYFQESELELVR